MLEKTLKIATRQSPLALWQANYVKDRLQQLYPDLIIELVPMVTKGDVILDSPLAKIGGKGLFVKELENALLNKEADIAVHSMKDVPMQFPEGLELANAKIRVMPLCLILTALLQSCRKVQWSGHQVYVANAN